MFAAASLLPHLSWGQVSLPASAGWGWGYWEGARLGAAQMGGHPGKASRNGRRSQSRGRCAVTFSYLFSANALGFLGGSTALLERQRLRQSLPLRLQDPLAGPGLRVLALPAPPLILGHLSSHAREERPGHGTGGESCGAARHPQPDPGCKNPPSECWGDEPGAHPPHRQTAVGAVLNSEGAPQA